METLRVISRQSPLALAQVAEVFRQLPEVPYSLTAVASFGDLHKQYSLLDGQASDFFTRELDLAILTNQADVAIHSAKDLPWPLPAGLQILALTRQANPSDSLVSVQGFNLSTLPDGARVGTSSATRRNQLMALRPDLRIVSIRGTIGERLQYLQNASADAIIVATCALERLGGSPFPAHELPLETHPLQGILAVVGHADNGKVKQLFSPIDASARYGKVCLAGFGPGNPDLLTLRALNRLQSAQVIVHDDLLDETFLERFEAQKIYAGKRRGQHSMPQEAINRLLLSLARLGKNVVRLKGGDPFIFGRGGEELEFLRSCYVTTEVIPGISAAIGAAASAGIPLTHRGVSTSVSFQTAHTAEAIRFTEADTQVFYMGSHTLTDILQKALAAGRTPDTPVALIRSATRADEQVHVSDIGTLLATNFEMPSPLIVILGKVAALYRLPGRLRPVILYTGTDCSTIEPYGMVIHRPFIKVEPIVISRENFRKIALPATFNWIIFTSVYGVKHYFRQLAENGFDTRSLGGVKFASVGAHTTAELARHGIKADLQPANESATGILDIFESKKLAPVSILLPRSAGGLPELPEGLARLGHKVTDFAVYQTVSLLPDLPDLYGIQLIAFASPSAIRAFFGLYPANQLPGHLRFVAKTGASLTELRKFVSTIKIIEGYEAISTLA